MTVGTPPIVTFVTPLSTNTLCAVGSTSGNCIPDSDGTTAGWQGNLDVTVSVTGVANPTGARSTSPRGRPTSERRPSMAPGTLA